MNIVKIQPNIRFLQKAVRSSTIRNVPSSAAQPCRCLKKQMSTEPTHTIANATAHTTTSPTDSESAGFQLGSVFGNMKQTLAKYMSRSLASKNLYEATADKVQYEDFFIACNMPDTFQSWFYVMQLHVWLILVRLRTEGSAGKNLSYSMVEIMWQDIDARIRLLDVNDTSQRKETLEEFAQQFFGLTIAYDEGLLGHDRVLASALWRNLFYNKPNTDAESLALMVDYVRKQIQYLETQSTEDITLYGKIFWLPLHDTTGQ